MVIKLDVRKILQSRSRMVTFDLYAVINLLVKFCTFVCYSVST